MINKLPVSNEGAVGLEGELSTDADITVVKVHDGETEGGLISLGGDRGLDPSSIYGLVNGEYTPIELITPPVRSQIVIYTDTHFRANKLYTYNLTTGEPMYELDIPQHIISRYHYNPLSKKLYLAPAIGFFSTFEFNDDGDLVEYTPSYRVYPSGGELVYMIDEIDSALFIDHQKLGTGNNQSIRVTLKSMDATSSTFRNIIVGSNFPDHTYPSVYKTENELKVFDSGAGNRYRTYLLTTDIGPDGSIPNNINDWSLSVATLTKQYAGGKAISPTVHNTGLQSISDGVLNFREANVAAGVKQQFDRTTPGVNFLYFYDPKFDRFVYTSGNEWPTFKLNPDGELVADGALELIYNDDPPPSGVITGQQVIFTVSKSGAYFAANSPGAHWLFRLSETSAECIYYRHIGIGASVPRYSRNVEICGNDEYVIYGGSPGTQALLRIDKVSDTVIDMSNLLPGTEDTGIFPWAIIDGPIIE